MDVWPVTMRLVESYEIASGEYTAATNVFVRLETDTGPSGTGCAAPDAAVTGETGAQVLAHYRDVLPGELVGANPLQRVRVLERLEALGLGPAARAGVDIALFDLLGKLAGVSLHRLLGGCRDEIATSVTVPILPEGETVERARRLVGQGFRALKIKGGKDADDDVARLRRVREAVGAGVELRFDANEGYDAAQAARLLRGVRSVGLAFVEQPTPRGSLSAMARARAGSDVAVMADESVMCAGDVVVLARAAAVDVVNVKLMKVGGIEAALAVAATSSAAGCGVMVGCMDEAALAIAAGLHFALGRPGIRYADLDGHLDLLGDPSAGAVQLRDGVLRPTGRPGLGFDVAPV